jgi:hypothetical protein
MKRYIITLVSVLIVLSAITFFSNFARPAYAQEPGPYYKVEPSTVQLGPESAINDTFTVSIKLYNVTETNVPAGVLGVEVHFTWNDSLVQPVNFTNMISQSGGVLNPTILYGINPGFYNATPPNHYAVPPEEAKYYLVSAASTGNPWWGNGTIAQITFKVLYKPTLSEGAIKANFTLVFTDLVDANGAPVDHRREDALYKILPSPGVFDVIWESTTYKVIIESDSIVSAPDNLALNVTSKTISFNVTTADGYCNVTIPKTLMKSDTLEEWNVTLNGQVTTNAVLTENATHTFIYIPLEQNATVAITLQSTWIVPEFSSTTLMLALFILSMPTLLMAKKLRHKKEIY